MNQRAETTRRVQECGLVPVIRASSSAVAMQLGRALCRGGVTTLEITLTVPGALSVMKELTAEFGDALIIGAGTLTSASQVRQCVEAGARFVVSPGHVAGLVEEAHALSVPAMPGALTPTEVMAALALGADFIKIFPCSALGGASYLKALSGPFPAAKLMPTGGVELATLESYVAAGASALGVGSALADTALMATEGEDALSGLANQYVQRLREARLKFPSQSFVHS